MRRNLIRALPLAALLALPATDANAISAEDYLKGLNQARKSSADIKKAADRLNRELDDKIRALEELLKKALEIPDPPDEVRESIEKLRSALEQARQDVERIKKERAAAVRKSERLEGDLAMALFLERLEQLKTLVPPCCPGPVLGHVVADGHSPVFSVQQGESVTLTFSFLDPYTRQLAAGPAVSAVRYAVNLDPETPDIYVDLGISTDIASAFSFEFEVDSYEPLIRATPYGLEGEPIFIPGVGGFNDAVAFVVNIENAPLPGALALVIGALIAHSAVRWRNRRRDVYRLRTRG